MTRGPRILLAAGALLLLSLFAAPLWRIDLYAPQYPEGLGMLIRLNTIEGVKEHDLKNINALNHYIGMRAIDPAQVPEMRLMPWVTAALIALGLAGAVTGKRALAIAWVAGLAAFGAAGIADFWWWGYQYGHNLDPTAIIVVPDMTYQPPLVGTKQLLNFTAISWPAMGTLFAGIALLCGVAAVLWRGDASQVDARPSVRGQRTLAGVAA